MIYNSKKREKSIKEIKIISVVDDNYVQHLGVMLYSLFEHQINYSNKLDVFVIDGGISEENKIKIEGIGKEFNIRIKFLIIDKKIYKNFKISHHINHSTYYRISIPDLLDSSVKKVIYLDCDLIFKEDISKLWEINISECFIAAVENPKFNRYIDLQMPINSKYFNTGVMLMNLEKCRQYDISSKVLKFIENNLDKMVLWDQDALNAILYNKCKELPPKWNQQTIMFEIDVSETNFKKEEFTEAIENPSIIHYTTSSKPWHYMNEHPLKNEYYKYLKKTPWRKYSPPDKNINNVLKKSAKKLLPNKMIDFLRRIKNRFK
jgi:lipopolysaccharide biosynthesis glycosyltransferase